MATNIPAVHTVSPNAQNGASVIQNASQDIQISGQTVNSSQIQHAPSQNGLPISVEDGPERFKTIPTNISLIRFMEIVHTITHIMIGAVVVAAFSYANLYGVNNLSLHIYFCVTGYVILMALGILSLNPLTGWARTIGYRKRHITHWMIQVIGSAFAITGSIIKIVNDIDHFSTVHGSLGIIAMIFTFITLLVGLAHMFTNAVHLTKMCHFVFGTITLIIAFLSLVFVFNDVYSNNILFELKNTSVMVSFCTIAALIGIIASGTMNTFRKSFQ